jgi:hypothetical protein
LKWRWFVEFRSEWNNAWNNGEVDVSLLGQSIMVVLPTSISGRPARRHDVAKRNAPSILIAASTAREKRLKRIEDFAGAVRGHLGEQAICVGLDIGAANVRRA